MDFELTDEQESIKENFDKFSKNEIAPNAETLDQASKEDVIQLIKGNIQKLADIGFLGLLHEEEFGGSDIDLISFVVAGEPISKACASTYLSAGASSVLFGIPLKLFGSKEQKEKYMKGIIDSSIIGCFGLTEPESGSDAAGIRTTAVKNGDKWILNGSKTLITNAPFADLALIMAYNDRDSGPGSGVTAFIVPSDTPGFSTGKPFDKMGYRGSPTGEIFLEDCELSDDAVLGKVGMGFKQAMQTLEYGRIGMATVSLGIGMACMEEANRYAGERKAFGKYINRFQNISFKLADMMILTDLSRLLIYKAAWAKDNNYSEASVLASCAKLFSSEAATQISNWALQIYGGYGYIKGYDVERLYRDAKLGDIGEGTSEIQRSLIARSILENYSE